MTTSSDFLALSPRLETADSSSLSPLSPLSSLPSLLLFKEETEDNKDETKDSQPLLFSLSTQGSEPAIDSAFSLEAEPLPTETFALPSLSPKSSPSSEESSPFPDALPLDWIKQKEKQAQWQKEEEQTTQWADFFAQEEDPALEQRLLDDVPASEQEEDIKKDIVEAWSQAHHPELHGPTDTPEHWKDIREELALRYNSPADDASLYKTLKTAYGDFTRRKTAFESLLEEKKEADYTHALKTPPLRALPPLSAEPSNSASGSLLPPLPPIPKPLALALLKEEDTADFSPTFWEELADFASLPATQDPAVLSLPKAQASLPLTSQQADSAIEKATFSPPALSLSPAGQTDSLTDSLTTEALTPTKPAASPSPPSWQESEPSTPAPASFDFSLEEELLTQKAPELASLYKEMQKITEKIADIEQIYVPDSSSQTGTPSSLELPLPFSPSQLAQTVPSLLKTAHHLTYLKPEDREALFKQLEKDAIQKHENTPKPTSVSDDIARALSRSHLKPLYGAGHYLGTITLEAEENIAKALGSFGVLSDFFQEKEQAAQRKREMLAHAERLRQIAQQRVAPLFVHEDGRGHKPQRHWSADIGVGLAEGFVPLALSLCARPALLAYAPTLIGNHYAESEARFMQAVAEGKLPHITEKTARESHHHRFLGAVASGSLQTLVEAGLPLHKLRPLFTQVPKLLPALRTSQALARPYIEQKAYSMSQSLGETYAQYRLDEEVLGEAATLDTQRLKKDWGNTCQNLSEYIATLPFVLLSLGRLPLSKIRDKQRILEDPALEKYFEIPKKKLEALKQETRPEVQSKEFQKALEDSPYWSNPLSVVQKYHLLPALDKVLAPETYSPEALSSPTLKKWLEKSAKASAQAPSLLSEAPRNLPNLPSLPKLHLPLPKGGESTLELAQLRWHAQGQRPTLTPVLHKEKLSWQLSLPEASHNQTKYYATPEKALISWRKQIDTRTSRQRHYALHPENFLLAHLSSSPETTASEVLPFLQEEVRHAQSLVAQKLLFDSHQGHLSASLTAEALLDYEKAQRTRLLSHLLEDALLYRKGKSSQEIITERLTHFWTQELDEKKLSPALAKDWIETWNRSPKARSQKNLQLSPQGSNQAPSSKELAEQLARLGLLAPTPELSLRFPPAFSEPTRRELQQLSHAAALSSLIEKTHFYSQELEKISPLSSPSTKVPQKASETEAFTRTLSHFLALPLENTYPHLNRLRPEELLSAQHLLPPALSQQTQKSLLWLSQKGFSPLFSLTDESTGKVAWMARYPNGEFSTPHASFLNAAHDWKVFSQKHLPEEMTLTGLESHAELLSHFYHQKGRAFSHLEAHTLPSHVSPEEVLLSPAQAAARSEIYSLHGGASPASLAENPSSLFQAAGANYEHIAPNGKITHKIEIYDPYDPLALIEEHAETMWRTHLRTKSFSLSEAESFLRSLEKESHQSYLPAHNQHRPEALRYTAVIEGLSQLTSEYSLLQAQESQLPLALRRWISFVHTSPHPSAEQSILLSRAENLEKALPALSGLGSVSSSQGQKTAFLPLLKESLGLDNPYQAERALLTPQNRAQENALALAQSPERLFEFLAPTQRAPFLKKLSSLLPDSLSQTPSNNTKDHYKSVSSLLRSLKQKSPSNLSPAEAQSVRELLRQSQKDTPLMTDKGLKYKNKLFSETSPHRPAGVPASWRVSALKEGTGLRYQNPLDKEEALTLMWGNPFDKHPVLQRPYVRHLKKGEYLNTEGQCLSAFHPATYLPLEGFLYKKQVLTPHAPLSELPSCSSSAQRSLLQAQENLLEKMASPSELKATLSKTPLGSFTSRRELLTQLELLEDSLTPNPEEQKLFKELQTSLKKHLSDFGDMPPSAEGLNAVAEKAQALKSSLFSSPSPSSPAP